jgi:hypothetical protein
MTTDRKGHNPGAAPSVEPLSTVTVAFILCTGPLAWFVQLCLGSMMSSWPCYPGDERLGAPLAGYGWTRAAVLVILVIGALLALLSGMVAWRRMQRVRQHHAQRSALVHFRQDRTGFLTLWGVLLGFGSAVAMLVTIVAFILVPRCVG